MCWRRVVSRFAAVLLVFVIWTAIARADTFNVTFAGQVVRVSGVMPGGSVAFVAALVEVQRQLYARSSRVEQVVGDADHDGVVTFDLGRTIPVRSIWGVVDLASGAHVVATPVAYPRRELVFSSDGIKNLPVDQFDQIAHGHVLLQVLWVRPGEAAWIVTTADGGANDADGKNDGKTVTSLSAFRSMSGNTPPPKKLKKDDVLILIDPFDMTFSMTQVNK